MRKIAVVFSIILLLLFSLFYFQSPFNLLRPVFHHDIIDRYAAQYGMDPLLITALIKVESNFFTRARSNRGAIGLMQLMPTTAVQLADELGFKGFKQSDLEDPEINIHLGMYYLHKLTTEFGGNQTLALAAYNAGRSKVMNWYQQNPLVGIETADIPYKETRNYVDNITGTYQWLKRIQSLINFIQGKK
jgi:soluble lytic murein transglycosylase